MVGVSHGICHAILHNDLNMHHVCSHMMPRNLTDKLREECALDRRHLIDRVISNLDIFYSFNRVVTGDKM
jgi:hypothetical protein